MSQDQKTFNPFLVQDTDESLKSKTGGVFGLNAGVNVTEIVFSDKAKDGSANNSVTITVQVGDRQYKSFLFFNPGEKVYVKNELVGEEAEGYLEAYYENLKQKIAVLKHSLKAVGTPAQQIDTVSAQLDPTQLAEGVQALVALAPANYKASPVDFFLEYQYSIKKEQKETFLEFPTSMKAGIFLISAVTPTGSWKEVIAEDGSLSYVDNAGSTHPFTKNSGYMKSSRAKRQTEEDNKKSANTGFSNSAANPQNANKSSWK